MKVSNSLFTILTLAFNTVVCAQFGAQQIISTEAFAPFSIIAADIDGDNDQDVLSASFGDNTIAWYENLDGQGNFSTLLIIADNVIGARYLHATDLDGDNDIDVVASAQEENLIVWFENIDGNGTFSNAKVIGANSINPKAVITADLDGDNDPDIIVASRDDNKVAWYENLDGNGNFGLEQVISTNVLGAISIYAADLDEDTDLDIIASASGNQSIYWIKNLNGQGDFGTLREISNNSFGVNSVFSADMDGDNDNDVLSALGGGNTIDWYENINGAGSFGSQQIITSNLDGGSDVVADDLDNDNDNDVVWVAIGSNEVAWQENDGDGNFSPKQLISNEHLNPTSVYVTDIDGDGAKDVVACSIADNKIAWYKNEILSVQENNLAQIVLSPNPVSDVLHIKNNGSLEIKTITIYDALGRKVKEQQDSESIEVSRLAKGVYLVKISSVEGVLTKQVVKN